MIVFLLTADAPRTPLGWELILTTAEKVGVVGGVATTALAVALSVSLQPLQFRLVQLLEGYWPGGHTGPVYRQGLGKVAFMQ